MKAIIKGIIKKGWLTRGAVLCATLFLTLFYLTGGQLVKADTIIGTVPAGTTPSAVAVNEVTNKILDDTFRKYDLVKIQAALLKQKAITGDAIALTVDNQIFDIQLEPNDLRAANYRAFESSADGRRELERGLVNTYKGKVRGDDRSTVRLTITDSEIEGLIYTESQKFYLLPLKRILPADDTGLTVVYRPGDILETINLEGDIEEQIEAGKAILSDVAEPLVAGQLRILEVATEADFQWVSLYQNAAGGNAKILTILNMIDGIYQRDLNLKVVVTFQNAWSTVDPYPISDFGTILNAFRIYWTDNFPASVAPRDVAHLFSGKGSGQGIAYTGSVCNLGYAYGVTSESATANHIVTAHEIGHNLGANHILGGECDNTIMNPFIFGNYDRLCLISIAEITNVINNTGSCLTLAPLPPLPTPTPTPTPTPMPTPTPTPTPPTPTPTPPTTTTPQVCTPTTTVTEGNLLPGGIPSFGVSSGPGSVTIDHVNAGTGTQSFTVVSATNATVNIPAFTPGTYAPVTATFTAINPALAVDYTLRAASTFHAIFVRVRCGGQTQACMPTATVTEGDLLPGGIPSFGVASGAGSVTVDHVNAGTGLRSFTVVSATNATVNIPAFAPGTYNPVTATYTIVNPNLAIDFTIRAASTYHAIFVRVRCGSTTLNTFSGRATSVNATIAGVNAILNDTGALPVAGGFITRSLLSGNLFGGALTTGELEATTQGAGDQSRSQAVVANLNLNVGGNTFTSDILSEGSQCTCTANGPVCEGGLFGNLRINGVVIAITGQPNQTVNLSGGGTVIINEQIRTGAGNAASLTANGVRVSIPDDPLVAGDQGANVILSSAHLYISCATQ